jgi:hypothetical protein
MSQVLDRALEVPGDAQRLSDLEANDAVRRAEEAAIAADLDHQAGKAARAARRNYERALDLQLNGRGRGR